MPSCPASLTSADISANPNALINIKRGPVMVLTELLTTRSTVQELPRSEASNVRTS